MFVEVHDAPMQNSLGTCVGFTHYFQNGTLRVKCKPSFTWFYISVHGLNMEKYGLKHWSWQD